MERFGELGGAELGLPPRDRLGWCAPRSRPGVRFGYTAMASISWQVTDTWRSSRAGFADLGGSGAAMSEVVAAGLVTLVPAARDQRLRNRRTAALT
jgi:hypothetical protein